MTPAAGYALAIGATFLVNVPFGWWRAGTRKFGPAWFVAVHAAVPIVIGVRAALDLPFRWEIFPLFVLAYFAGQSAGAGWRARRGSAQPRRP